MTIKAPKDTWTTLLDTDEEPSGPRPRVVIPTPEPALATRAPANDVPWLRPIIARDGSFRC